MAKWLRINSPLDSSGKWLFLGSTPLNDKFLPCDGSYGLIEYCEDNLPPAIATHFGEVVEEELLGMAKSAPLGSYVHFMGFSGRVVEETE